MIKLFYTNSDKTASIVHSTQFFGVSITSIKYKFDRKHVISLIRDILKDIDTHQESYHLPSTIALNIGLTPEELNKLGFIKDFETAVWSRATGDYRNEPYEIVSGRYIRGEGLTVNDSIEGEIEDDLYIVRNVYKDELLVVKSKYEAERYMTP